MTDMNQFIAIILFLTIVQWNMSVAMRPYATIGPDPICPTSRTGVSPRREDYIYTPCIGGHKLHKKPYTWNEARKICQEEGGHLAIINSFTEAKILKNIFQNVTPSNIIGSNDTDNAAIGIHDYFEDNNYVTLHGDSIYKAGYAEWAAGQPDNAYGGEQCGAITRDGALNDISCEKPFAFFCEIPYVEV